MQKWENKLSATDLWILPWHQLSLYYQPKTNFKANNITAQVSPFPFWYRYYLIKKTYNTRIALKSNLISYCTKGCRFLASYRAVLIGLLHYYRMYLSCCWLCLCILLLALLPSMERNIVCLYAQFTRNNKNKKNNSSKSFKWNYKCSNRPIKGQQSLNTKIIGSMFCWLEHRHQSFKCTRYF